MDRLKAFIKSNGAGIILIMAAALIGGFFLRVLGTDFCLPIQNCHPDEHYLVTPAMRMLKTGDFNPHIFVYPSLYIYILFAVFGLTFFIGVSKGLWSHVGQIKAPLFIEAGRITTACLGTGTLWGVYAAGRRILDPISSAVAALALAVMPLHVSSSHFVTTDVAAGFFGIFALWAAARVALEGEKHHYIWAGLLIGFTAASKYNAALVLINLPIAHWINSRRKSFFDGNLLQGLAWVVLGFLIACPYALLDLPAFLNGVAMEIAHYNRSHPGHQGDYNRLFYFIFLASRGFGPFLTGLGIFGLWALLRRYKPIYLLIIIFPLLYFFFVGSYKVRFVRNLIPVLPYLALWIGFGAVEAFRQVRATWPRLERVAPWKLAVPGLAIVLATPLFLSAHGTLAMIRPDTRFQARAWIEKHIPAGSTLCYQAWSVEAFTPGKYQITKNRFSWDYYIGTDRLSRKNYYMNDQPHKNGEARQAFQHPPVAIFEGLDENPFHYVASPTVFIFKRDPSRPRIKPPGKRPPPPRPCSLPKPTSKLTQVKAPHTKSKPQIKPRPPAKKP